MLITIVAVQLAIVHYLLLGGSIVLVLAAAFVLIRVRIGQPRKLRKVPGPMQMMRNAGQKIPARIVPRPPATATAAAEVRPSLLQIVLANPCKPGKPAGAAWGHCRSRRYFQNTGGLCLQSPADSSRGSLMLMLFNGQ